MLNILFLIRSLECGGAERQLALLANGLARRGHKVTVATFYAGGMRERDLSESVRLATLDKRSVTDMAGFMIRLMKLVREVRPDIIHGYLTAGNLAAAACMPAASRASIVWALRDSNMDLSKYGSVTRWTSKAARFLAFITDLTIANSAAGLEHARASGYPHSRLQHVPNGIDTDEFYPDARGAAAFRQLIGIDAGVPLIGLVGRLDPMKDHENFLAAAHRLKQSVPDIRFVCAGGGPDVRRARLSEISAELGLSDRMHWVPNCNDMRGLYSALDVFCLASRYGEGFPNVLGEAMACARPCVATNVGDSALVAGVEAVIVPPGDPEALAAAIRLSLNKQQVPEARARILSEFSIEKMIARTESLLLSCRSTDLHLKARYSF